MSRVAILTAIILGLIVLGTRVIAPTPVFAGGATCSASPDSVVIGGVINLTCSGFTPNSIVNSYVVDDTGFAENGNENYSACLVGVNATRGSAKVNEAGVAHYIWYTQNGVNTCPFTNYAGYANHLGAYTVVVQELDGKGNIVAIAKVEVRITSNASTVSGAILATDGPGISGGTLTVYGAGFAPNEIVNLWFTRPGNCSGQGEPFWTGVSAFDPSVWDIGGIFGAGSIKADSSGAFVSVYSLVDHHGTAFPCLGTWSVTAHALGSGVGAETTFLITGNSVTENAKVWTLEDRVPSNQSVDNPRREGITVHVYGSGFPAGGHVNCWYTRPDGTVYIAFPAVGENPSFTVGADGTFAAFVSSFTGDIRLQGDQPGTWAITCHTSDGKYTGIAHFVVYPLPFIDP